MVVLHFGLSFAVKWYVNKTLARIPEYKGHVESIDLDLWRGAYVIREIKILKKNGKIPVPFLEVPEMESSLDWKSLLHGAFVGKIKLYDPVMNIVNGSSPEASQLGIDQPWFTILKELFPLRLDRCEVMRGSIHYRDFSTVPQVNLKVDQVHFVVTNLSNSEELAKSLVATMDVEGRIFKESRFWLNAKLNPMKKLATFVMNIQIDPFSLTQLNDFTQAYGDFDFAGGTCAITSELAASDGVLTGYVKPLLDHVAVVQVQEDIKDPLRLVWKGMIGGLFRLFRNLPNDRFATKIPIQGNISEPHAAILPAIGNVLKNEFIRVYTTDLEKSVHLKQAQEATRERTKK
jgi:hypothetical protein